jgi:hypothetical protein
MGYPNSLQQNFPFQPAHVGHPAHNQQQNSPYQTGPPAFNQQQNFPYQPVHIGQPSYFNQTSTLLFVVWSTWLAVVALLIE